MIAEGLTWIAGLLIIAGAVATIARQVEVRLVLTLAGLALGAVAGDPMAVVRTFLITLCKEQFVVPICTAMGFAYVLRQTGCDQHLVRLLVRPLQRVRGLLIPGAVLVGFLVNVPIISQASTLAAIGSVLVPLLRAAGVSRVTTGAALLLGSSLGGELLNPGAPEFRTITTTLKLGSPAECVQHVLPLLLIELVLAVSVFWWLSARDEGRLRKEEEARLPSEETAAPEELPVNWLKAAVPLLPITLLFLSGPPLALLPVPRSWLEESGAATGSFESRLIGAAMLVGVVAAALTSGKKALQSSRAFFEGAGYAFASIISLIVSASCFGEGVRLLGLARLLGQLIDYWPALLLPTAGLLPLAFAWLCGSGMATTQSLFSFFVLPAQNVQMDPVSVGAVVSIAGAAGRTMSPVAAVTLMSAALTDTRPLDLVRRVAGPLLVGITGVVVAACFWAAQ
jgi:DcuC family C4-dicarboxylate transporter